MEGWLFLSAAIAGLIVLENSLESDSHSNDHKTELQCSKSGSNRCPVGGHVAVNDSDDGINADKYGEPLGK